MSPSAISAHATSARAMSRSAWIAAGLVALMLGGCIGGSGRDSASLRRSFAGEAASGQRTVSVPTRLSTGGRGAAPSSLLILGVN